MLKEQIQKLLKNPRFIMFASIVLLFSVLFLIVFIVSRGTPEKAAKDVKATAQMKELEELKKDVLKVHTEESQAMKAAKRASEKIEKAQPKVELIIKKPEAMIETRATEEVEQKIVKKIEVAPKAKGRVVTLKPPATAEKKAVLPKPKPKAKPKKAESAYPKVINDPFQVSFKVKKLDGEEEEEEAEKAFVLRGVIVGDGREVALIDDIIVQVGDYVYGWKVVGIKDDRVGLKSGRLSKTLVLKDGGLVNEEE